MANNKRYSFFQLFTTGNDERPSNYRLVIPIIQRDYAQGRDNDKAKSVRRDFLSQLYEYMLAPSGTHDLDFVYGVSSPASDNSKKKEFVPLDGQQRLTTLFLIHYYLAVRVRDTEAGVAFFKTMRLKTANLTECLFSYRTRTSASEFCNGLFSDDNDFSFVFTKDDKGKRITDKPLSFHIQNAEWFYPDWKQDSTVNSMLTMLDAIDCKFDGIDYENVLKRLMSDNQPSVSFIFMDLDDYKLTDDLYIKMNSRGKPLTSFENFKAKYEQYIGKIEAGEIVNDVPAEENSDDVKFVYNSDNGIIRKYDKRLCEFAKEITSRGNCIINSVKSNFSFNIDTSWSYLFWEYSKDEIKEAENNDGEKSIDKLLTDTLDLKISRFIKMVFANQYAVEHIVGKAAIPDELTSEKGLSFSNLEELEALSADGIIELTRMFELFSNASNRLEIKLPDWANKKYYDEKGVFESMINGKGFTFTKRLLLYAYTKFRLEFGDDKRESLTEWMRFIYNLTFDDNAIQTIDKNTYRRAVASVNTLIEKVSDAGTSSIINLLASSSRPKNIDFFPEYQYREEILKAYLFEKDEVLVLHAENLPELSSPIDKADTWGELILKLESHPYFTGQIGFILKMAGIDEYFENHNNLDWHYVEDAKFKNAVVKYGQIASVIFDGGYGDRKLADNALFERAMLAQSPEYLNDNFLNSKNKSAGSNNLLRDLSWKSFLRLSTEHTPVQKMVLDLFDALHPNDIYGSLNRIISQNIEAPQWRKDIIRYPYLMGKSRNGYFARTESGHRILKNSINFSMWDHEVYSFVLYWEFLHSEWENNYSSIYSLSYGNSNANNEIPYVKITYGDIVVKVKSYVKDINGDLTNYYLWVNSNGDANVESFLTNNGFDRKNDNDTIYRKKENPADDFSEIDDYRKHVASNLFSFMTDLISFLQSHHHGQRES